MTNLAARGKRATSTAIPIGLKSCGSPCSYPWAGKDPRREVDPRPAHPRRILDLAFVAEALVELYAPDEAGAWLYSRNRLLDGQRPADLIGKGDVDPVLQVVALLKDGAYA